MSFLDFEFYLSFVEITLKFYLRYLCINPTTRNWHLQNTISWEKKVKNPRMTDDCCKITTTFLFHDSFSFSLKHAKLLNVICEVELKGTYRLQIWQTCWQCLQNKVRSLFFQANITSVSKKLGQSVIVYYYCALSQIFWNRR